MFAEKNKKHMSTMGIEMSETATFHKLSEFIGEDLHVKGFIITTGGKYGKSVAVAIDENTFISLPKRYVEEFESFTDDEIEAVKAGKLVLANIRMISSKNGDTMCFDYADAV